MNRQQMTFLTKKEKNIKKHSYDINMCSSCLPNCTWILIILLTLHSAHPSMNWQQAHVQHSYGIFAQLLSVIHISIPTLTNRDASR